MLCHTPTHFAHKSALMCCVGAVSPKPHTCKLSRLSATFESPTVNEDLETKRPQLDVYTAKKQKHSTGSMVDQVCVSFYFLFVLDTFLTELLLPPVLVDISKYSNPAQHLFLIFSSRDILGSRSLQCYDFVTDSYLTGTNLVPIDANFWPVLVLFRFWKLLHTINKIWGDLVRNWGLRFDFWCRLLFRPDSWCSESTCPRGIYSPLSSQDFETDSHCCWTSFLAHSCAVCSLAFGNEGGKVQLVYAGHLLLAWGVILDMRKIRVLSYFLEHFWEVLEFTWVYASVSIRTNSHTLHVGYLDVNPGGRDETFGEPEESRWTES